MKYTVEITLTIAFAVVFICLVIGCYKVVRSIDDNDNDDETLGI